MIGTFGCARRPGVSWTLPVNETAERIVADDDGAWVLVANRPALKSDGKIPFTSCEIRRYRRDGSVVRRDSLGTGGCRILRTDKRGLLALMVSDFNAPELRTSLWLFDGHEWRETAPLPCVAIGAHRLASGSLLVWDETKLYRSDNEGGDWRQLRLERPQDGQAHLDRNSVISELADGRIVLAIQVYGGQRTTIRIGSYGEANGFVHRATLVGRLSATAQQPNGDSLLLIHKSDSDGGDPSLQLYSVDFARGWTPQLVYERSSILPNELAFSRGQLLIVGSGWKKRPSFFSGFPTHVVAMTPRPSGVWSGQRKTDLDGLKPRLISFAPGGAAWCTSANARSHALVFVPE